MQQCNRLGNKKFWAFFMHNFLKIALFALGFLPGRQFPKPELPGLIEELGELADYMAGNQVSEEEARETLEYAAGRIWDSAAPAKFKIVGYALVGILSLFPAVQYVVSAFRRPGNPAYRREAGEEAVPSRSDW